MFRVRSLVVAAAVAVPLALAPMAFAAPPSPTPPTIPAPNPLKPTVLCPPQGGLCVGTKRGDTIIGQNVADLIYGLEGDDDIEQNLVFLFGPSDDAHGGPGRDCIDGGGGVSRQFGDAGDDNVPCQFTAFVDPQAALTSGPGADIVHGGTGNDSMDGIFDSDKLYGDAGDDLINDPYLTDKDELYGGPGNDILNAADLGNDDIVNGDGPFAGDTGGPGGGKGKGKEDKGKEDKGKEDKGKEDKGKSGYQETGENKDVDTCYGDPGDTFINCEKIIKSVVPLLISPSGKTQLPRAFVEAYPDVALPPLTP